MITISFNAPSSQLLNYHIKPEWWTIEGAYENWIGIRQPPFFGTEPDARVLALAGEAPDPKHFRVLDVGAGTGRNAVGLARRGYPVDAVELTPKFADIIRTDADRELLDMRVIQRDVFATLDDLRQDYQLIVLSEVVSDFRTKRRFRSVSSSPAIAWHRAGACCSTRSWPTKATHLTTPPVNSDSSRTQACSPETRWPPRPPDSR